MDYLSIVLCLVLPWIVVHLLLSISKKSNESNTRKLPPGPPALPIFGNLFSLSTKPHITLAELGNKYGPIIMLQLGQIPTVIISSAAIAKEALHKNDLLFSSRHVIDAARVHNHHENSVAWLPSLSSQWRSLRKICNSQVFSASRLDASQSVRGDKMKDLLSNVEKSCEDGTAVEIAQAAFTTALNLLPTTFFSVDLGDPISDFARQLRQTIRSFLIETGKPNLADYFPILQKIDPQGIRRRTAVQFGKVLEVFRNIIDQRLQGERPSGSIKGNSNDVLDVLLGLNQEKIEELEPSKLPHLLVDLFAGGTDTTSTTVEWAMAELLHNPEKLKKAQKELQEIIGKGNPVKESDISMLSYLQAIIKETLRLHPPLPLMLPKKTDQDVNLFGFTVPKNAQVLVNVWAIGRDPIIWKNPTCFEPERFMGSDIDIKGHHFELIPFGAGRRICPGLSLAIRMIPLMLGTLIHGFDWKLEDGVSPEKMDMEEKFGITLEKAQRLRAIPVRV